jgi:hypothetical protein
LQRCYFWKVSACVLCSDAYNFFIGYQILTYE